MHFQLGDPGHETGAARDLGPWLVTLDEVIVSIEELGSQHHQWQISARRHDWPVCLLAGEYAAVLDATNTLLEELTAAERAAVLGGTVTRVYGLTS